MVKKKNLFAIIFVILLVMTINLVPVHAAETSGPTKTWSYSTYGYGSYVPLSGKMTSTFYDVTIKDYFITNVNFSLSDYNVTKIRDYNNGGDNPGDNADGKNCYMTLDVTSTGDSTDDKVEVTSIASTLPNPKYDIEDDNFDNDPEESEVVALGTVSATSYKMTTYWYDFRTGYSGDSGKIRAQFSMSAKGLFDYNNVVQAGAVQASFAFGDYSGRP